MTSRRRTVALGLRILGGAILVALAARYGALSRSPWTVVYAGVALSIAMALTRKHFWRKSPEPGQLWLTKRIVGTVFGETVLAAALFLLAYAVAWMIGTAKPLAPLHEHDFDYALTALVVSLVIFGLVTLLEDGKDPIDAAMEDLEASLQRQNIGEPLTSEHDGSRHVSDIERVEKPGREGILR